MRSSHLRFQLGRITFVKAVSQSPLLAELAEALSGLSGFVFWIVQRCNRRVLRKVGKSSMKARDHSQAAGPFLSDYVGWRALSFDHIWTTVRLD